MAQNPAEIASVADVEKRLATKYPDLAPDHVAAVVRGAHARFEESKIRDFVPLFVERRAGAELAQAGLAATADVVSA